MADLPHTRENKECRQARENKMSLENEARRSRQVFALLLQYHPFFEAATKTALVLLPVPVQHVNCGLVYS